MAEHNAASAVQRFASAPRRDSPPLSAEAVFNELGPAYESAFAGLPEQAASLEWILSQLAKRSPQLQIQPAKILDIGCGTGRPVCAALADAGHDVLGIDISSTMLAAARRHVPNARFEQVDVRNLAVEARSYDAVTVYFGLITGVTQDEIRRCIGEIYDWLKPGGVFVFATVPVAVDGVEVRFLGRRIVVSSLAAEDAVEWIRKVGFEVVNVAESSFTPRAVEAVIGPEDVQEEPHLFVYAKKST